MGKVSAIEWTDATWNPWYGCTKVSEGCANCYMERWARRTGRDPAVITRAKPSSFDAPLRWKEPSKVFVCSLGDFFHEDAPDEWRKDAWYLMGRTPRHTYLLLTKRPENVGGMMTRGTLEFSKNIWIGVSAENQRRADERVPYLMGVSAPKRFVSAEPLLGPLEFNGWLKPFEGESRFVDWVITGGESGPQARPCNLEWVRSIRDQCTDSGVAFFHKQHGGNVKIDGAWGGRMLDGRTWSEVPNG